MFLLKSLNKLSDSSKVRRAWFVFACAAFIIAIAILLIFIIIHIFTKWGLVQRVLNDEDNRNTMLSAMANLFSIALIITLIDILMGLPWRGLWSTRTFVGRSGWILF